LQSASAAFAAASMSSKSYRASPNLRATASFTSLAAACSIFSRSKAHYTGPTVYLTSQSDSAAKVAAAISSKS